MFTLRRLFVPTGTRQVDAVELWEVRWQSRHGEYSGSIRPESEVFPKREDAEAFAQALRDAFRLIKHTSGTSVKIEYKTSV